MISGQPESVGRMVATNVTRTDFIVVRRCLILSSERTNSTFCASTPIEVQDSVPGRLLSIIPLVLSVKLD